MGVPLPEITSEALRTLQTHPFPGNVRELKNVMERALILSAGRPVQREHLQLFQSAGGGATATKPAAEAMPTTTAAPSSFEQLPMDLESAEQALIQRALEQTGGNVAEAARLLKVNRSRIYRRFPNAG
jgi:DNA-binding NtrC family response regulator